MKTKLHPMKTKFKRYHLVLLLFVTLLDGCDAYIAREDCVSSRRNSSSCSCDHEGSRFRPRGQQRQGGFSLLHSFLRRGRILTRSF